MESTVEKLMTKVVSCIRKPIASRNLICFTGPPSTFFCISCTPYRARSTDSLSWDRKSYLADVNLPRLSREDCALVVLKIARHYRQATSLLCEGDVIILCRISAYSATFGSFLK